MIPTAIVFDFDGVIVESAGIKTHAFRRLFEDDYPELADAVVEYHLQHEGISRYRKFEYVYETLLGRPLDSATSETLGRRFSDLVLKGILGAPFVAGAREYIESHAESVPLFVASGTPQEELEHIVRARELDVQFTEVHGTPRTKEEIILELIERYDLEPDRMVFVGDAESDLRAATATGLVFVARVTETDGKLADWPVQIRDLTTLGECIAGL